MKRKSSLKVDHDESYLRAYDYYHTGASPSVGTFGSLQRTYKKEKEAVNKKKAEEDDKGMDNKKDIWLEEMDEGIPLEDIIEGKTGSRKKGWREWFRL